jgi:co-chaperonin GroES (HSP10)
MALELGPDKVKIKHLPDDIVLQTPWGDAILIGEVTAIGEDVKDIEVGDNVTFARRDGYLVNEGVEEYWIVDAGNVLEYEVQEE